MVFQKYSTPFLLLFTVFFLASHLHHLNSFAQLLPIVDPQGANASIQIYIVHVDLPENFLTSEDRENWYHSFLPNTTLDSGEPRLLCTYQHVINGFAARLTREELQAMETMDGFVSAQPDRQYPLLTTYTPEFLGLNQFDNSIWAKSNYGEGAIIGVLDTGITPNHTSFKDDEMLPPPKRWRGCCQFNTSSCSKWVPTTCNNKLIGARATGFAFSPIDALGHGTHTAGTAAGNFVADAGVLGQARGNAVGMAPRAHLAAYKVCTETGHSPACHSFAILSGIDLAIEDGVDVLSISIGQHSEPFYDSTIFTGTFAAMEKGIIASCCAGNFGITKNALANDAPWILTVGASSIDRVVRATVKLGNGMELDGESAYQPENFNSSMMPIAFPGIVHTDPKLACLKGSLDDEDVKGKLVLCGVGINENTEKNEIVKAAGGAGLILWNPKWDGFTTKSEPHILPTAYVTYADSLKIINYAKTSPDPTATIIFKGTQFNARRSPAVAAFSSRGPSLINGGIIKPDIIGPGVNILAAWHTDVGPDASGSSTSAFNFASGCSMATPHLAGIAALLKSVHPDWSPAAIKSAIVTTAQTLDREGKPIADEKSSTMDPASYFDMGAGHVDPSKAQDPGLIYDLQSDEYIGYLCSLRYSDTQVKMIVRRQIKCSSVKKISAEQLNYPSILVSLDSSSTKTINRTVTNVGEAKSVYSLQIDEPKGVSVEVSPSKLQFSNYEEKRNFTIEFSKKENTTVKGQYSEGQLSWVSNKHVVRSPIAVKF